MTTARQLLYAAAFIVIAVYAVFASAQPLTMRSAPLPGQAASNEIWQLSFHLSGGFSGVDQRLELASTGSLTARDRKRGKDVAVQISSNEVARVAGLIADLKSVAADGRFTCPDCLTYEVEIRTGGKSLVFRLHDGTLANSGLAPLVQALTSLLDDAWTGRLGPPPR